MYFDYFRNYLILGVFCEHFDIAKVTYLPPNLRIFLTFRPKHSQDLLWFSHSTDVFKHMFLLQTYVQVSENNFFWIHLIDFSLKSIEQTRKKNPMKLFFRKWVLTIFFLLFPCSVFLSFFLSFFCLLSLAVGFVVRSDCVHLRLSWVFAEIRVYSTYTHCILKTRLLRCPINHHKWYSMKSIYPQLKSKDTAGQFKFYLRLF